MDTADLSTATSLAAAVAALVAFALVTRSPAGRTAPWWLPALPLAPFAAWSLYAVVADGPRGLWEAHTGSPWETQIWMDLLILAVLVWLTVQPRLRALDAPRVPWVVLIVATGSIGALSLLLWLNAAERTADQQGVRDEVAV